MTFVQVSAVLLALFGLTVAVSPPYGQLSVQGTKVVGSNGQPVALHGMSLYWSQWAEGSGFYNAETVNALKCSWNANIVRAAMAVDQGGYLTDPTTNQARVEAVVDAAIAAGIYVIIDWHVSDFYQTQAIQFFSNISAKYAGNPNIIYEVFNEPLQVSWTDSLVPYHTALVNAIRANDKQNLIVLGTPTWSQDVDVASQNPVSGTNLAYTLHYYAATHGQSLRDKAQTALNNGIAIFVTEYGTVQSSGDGAVDQTSSDDWWTFLDSNSISYANWAIENKSEGAAALNPGTTSSQVADSSVLTSSGSFVKAKLLTQSNGVSCSSSGNAATTAKVVATTAKVAATTVGNVQTTTKVAATTKASSSGGSVSGVSISAQVSSSWNGGAEYSLVFTNSGSSAVCGVVFTLTMPAGSTASGGYNYNAVSGNEYNLPSWVNIPAGGSWGDAGLAVAGSGAPIVAVVSVQNC